MDNRGTISQQGNLLRVDNALVEEVFTRNRDTGNLLVSYAVPAPNRMTRIELLRLNVSRNTLILNSFNVPIRLNDIRKGMWIDSLFSPLMTRSNPPQSNAFLIVARQELQQPVSVTTDRIAKIDFNNNLLYTGNPNDINSQMRFVITDFTMITNRNGSPISLRSLRPGQMVRITHPNFQTFSIPPQTTALHIQLL